MRYWLNAARPVICRIANASTNRIGDGQFGLDEVNPRHHGLQLRTSSPPCGLAQAAIRGDNQPFRWDVGELDLGAGERDERLGSVRDAPREVDEPVPATTVPKSAA